MMQGALRASAITDIVFLASSVAFLTASLTPGLPPVADAAFAVAHHNERRKAEALAAFYHFRNAVDGYELVDNLAAFFFLRFVFRACFFSYEK